MRFFLSQDLEQFEKRKAALFIDGFKETASRPGPGEFRLRHSKATGVHKIEWEPFRRKITMEETV